MTGKESRCLREGRDLQVLAERARGTEEKGNERELRRDGRGSHGPVEAAPATHGAQRIV